jgi:hypothetical protein
MAAALAGRKALDKPLDNDAMPDFAMHALLPHPDTPEHAVRTLSVAVERDGARLWLRYVVGGDMEAIAWPSPASHEFTDGLWQNTCFEVFVRGGQGAAYIEGNFSPSWEYAFYGFSGHRAGMTRYPNAADPGVALDWHDDQFGMEVTMDLASVSPELVAQDWTIGLSAVIENKDGHKSYHALAHPGGAPDFHHAACFALELKA